MTGPSTARVRTLVAAYSIPAIVAVILSLRIAREQFDLVSGLLFLFVAGGALMLATDIVASMGRAAPDTRRNLRFTWVVVVALIAGLELFLRFGAGRQATYLELNNGGPYISIRKSISPDAVFVNRPNGEIRTQRPEYSYYRKMNALGLADREFTVEKAPGEYRIVALGDSFTEGWGAPYEGTWVKVMERSLAAHVRGRPITTMNAGVGGSDPFYEYMLLKARLLPYHPDLVIVAINGSDIVDVAIRGGMERFRPDGTVRPVVPPAWEWLYGISYITRAVVHGVLGYNSYFVPRDQVPAREADALRKIMGALDAFVALSQEQHFDLVVTLMPSAVEAASGAWIRPLDELALKAAARPEIHFVDLLSPFSKTGITQAISHEYFWPIDAHPTPKGYDVLGRAVAAGILQFGLIKDAN